MDYFLLFLVKMKCSSQVQQIARYGNLINSWKIMTPKWWKASSWQTFTSPKERGNHQTVDAQPLSASIDLLHGWGQGEAHGHQMKETRTGRQWWETEQWSIGWGRWGWKCNRNRHGRVKWADLQEIITRDDYRSKKNALEKIVCILSGSISEYWNKLFLKKCPNNSQFLLIFYFLSHLFHVF